MQLLPPGPVRGGAPAVAATAFYSFDVCVTTASGQGVPLTLHGGSGTDDDDFRKAIAAGVTIVHINTEIRLAWRRGLEAALAETRDDVVPYRLYSKPLDEVRMVASKRLRLFNGV